MLHVSGLLRLQQLSRQHVVPIQPLSINARLWPLGCFFRRIVYCFNCLYFARDSLWQVLISIVRKWPCHNADRRDRRRLRCRCCPGPESQEGAGDGDSIEVRASQSLHKRPAPTEPRLHCKLSAQQRERPGGDKRKLEAKAGADAAEEDSSEIVGRDDAECNGPVSPDVTR